MTSEHIREVIEFMDRESRMNQTKEDIISEFREIGFFDSNGNYATPYRHLGRWIDECTRKAKEEQTELT